MPLFWLCYRHNNQVSVVIQLGASITHARMRAAFVVLEEGTFTGTGPATPENRGGNAGEEAAR